MSWTSFKDAADRSLKRRGLATQVDKSRIVHIANDAIIEFFGHEAKDKVRAMYMRQGILTIAVLDDKLFKDINLSKKELIRDINKKFSKDIIIDCQFLN